MQGDCGGRKKAQGRPAVLVTSVEDDRCWHTGHGTAALECGPPTASPLMISERAGSDGLMSMAMMVARGTNSCSSSSRFGPNPRPISHPRDVAAGLFQDGVISTGSNPAVKPMGIVAVAALPFTRWTTPGGNERYAATATRGEPASEHGPTATSASRGGALSRWPDCSETRS